MLGLPDDARACLFDLDGVLTDTASVHTAAWKEAFDGFLRDWDTRHDLPFVPFDPKADYQRYVDGRPRPDGVRTFLASRSIALPEGTPEDPPTAETVWGLGNRKNDIFQRRLHEDGVHVFEGSRRYVDAVRAAGLARAVVSSSANTAEVLAVAGLGDRFDVRIDGVVIEQEHLPGKPAPDTYLAAAKALGVPASAGVVFEDALAGVEAGHRGRFGFVVGVDRVGHADALRKSGADVVVTDLAQLLEPT